MKVGAIPAVRYDGRTCRNRFRPTPDEACMPEFTFEALASTGQRSQGTLTANSEREALAQLDARGLFPIKVAPAQSAARSRFGRKIKARNISTAFSQLADLLRSGVPLMRS